MELWLSQMAPGPCPPLIQPGLLVSPNTTKAEAAVEVGVGDRGSSQAWPEAPVCPYSSRCVDLVVEVILCLISALVRDPVSVFHDK